MTKSEYRVAKQKILDTATEEIITRKRLEDENGVQFVPDYTDYISEHGNMRTAFEIRGKTHNWKVNKTTDKITVAGVDYTEADCTEDLGV